MPPRIFQQESPQEQKVPRHHRIVTLICLAVISLIIVSGIWFHPYLLRGLVQAQSVAGGHMPYSPVERGPYRVEGNRILDRDGHHYMFYGMSRDGLEYSCTGDGPLDRKHLAYIGAGTDAAGETYWGANTVRLPLSQGFWLRGSEASGCTADAYQTLVRKTVQTLTDLRLNVIIDLHWSSADGQSGEGGGTWAMPDSESTLFWQDLAILYKDMPHVLFELYNEPHPTAWECWQGPCTMEGDKAFSHDCQCTKTLTYESPGMQSLFDTIRATGADNLVIVGGMNWAYDFSQLERYPLTGSNIVYSTHPYPYEEKMPLFWENAFGKLSQEHPIISTESGQYDCGSDYMEQLLDYFDARKIGWIGWAWTVNDNICRHPLVVQDYQGTPAKGMGEYLYQHLQRYIPDPAQIARTWYFPDDQSVATNEGNGQRYTLANPDSIVDCPVKFHSFANGKLVFSHTLVVTHQTRLHLTSEAAGRGASTVVTVDLSSSCPGVVVERSQVSI